jgi:hypothetical protein
MIEERLKKAGYEVVWQQHYGSIPVASVDVTTFGFMRNWIEDQNLFYRYGPVLGPPAPKPKPKIVVRWKGRLRDEDWD